MAESQHANHVTPLKVYLTVGMLLFVLTGVTVTISKVHLGPWNAIVALAIASIKGLLVALFFMHLFYDKKIYALVVSTALVILAIFIGLTMADVLRRGDIYENQGYPINPQAKIYKHSGDNISTASHGLIAHDSSSAGHNTPPADSAKMAEPDTNSSGGTGH
jgi:cytochrome c oxidase subunit 4